MFSNDQTVGYVAITQKDNPRLSSETNREGLLDYGAATGDFIALIQTVLTHLRSKPYEQYAAAVRRAREQQRPPREAIDAQFKKLRAGALDEDAARELAKLESAVTSEREVAEVQVARTQDLSWSWALGGVRFA